jgi:diketogulonate reductase-like aldo/keto reductase
MIKPINRREFLVNSAILAAASSLPASVLAQDKMRTRTIPGTTESLPVIGMGAPDIFINLPEEGKELPISVIQAMLDLGGKMMDTPAFFRPNDPVLGQIINEMNILQDLFLVGKITTAGKEEGVAHLERTVKNLNKNPMDLLLVHNMKDMKNNWPTLQQWKEEGRTRYNGVSLTRQHDYTELEKFMKTEKPDFLMTGYSITQPQPEARILPLAQDLGIAVVGVEPFKAFDDGAFFKMVAGKKIPEWAAEFGINSWAQYSLKWIISNPALTSVVTETSKVKHVIDNMGAGFGDLPDAATRKKMSDHLLAMA